MKNQPESNLPAIETEQLLKEIDNDSVDVNDVHEGIVGCVSMANRRLFYLSALLYKFKNDEMYKKLGCDSFREYFGSYIDGMSYNKAINLAKIFRRFKPLVEQGLMTEDDFAAIGYEKANRISKFADSQHIGEWLAKAKSMTQNELRAEIKQADGDEPKTLQDSADESGQTVVGGEVVPGWIGDIKKRIDSGVDDTSKFAEWLIEIAQKHQ